MVVMRAHLSFVSLRISLHPATTIYPHSLLWRWCRWAVLSVCYTSPSQYPSNERWLDDFRAAHNFFAPRPSTYFMVSVIPFLVPFELAYTFLLLGGEHVEHALSRSNRGE